MACAHPIGVGVACVALLASVSAFAETGPCRVAVTVTDNYATASKRIAFGLPPMGKQALCRRTSRSRRSAATTL